VQHSIIPAAAAAVSNTQSRMASSSAAESKDGAGGLADPQFMDDPGRTSPCTGQLQQKDNVSTDDNQMRAFRGVLRVVLVVLESCLCLAGFPVPGTPLPRETVNGSPGEHGETGLGMVTTSSCYARELVAQHQGWCSCMAAMWRNILDFLVCGVPRYRFHLAAHAAVQLNLCGLDTAMNLHVSCKANAPVAQSTSFSRCHCGTEHQL
jgi:hypothetical protein